jgi:hypothetical protein
MKKQGFGEKHAKPLFFRDFITEMPRMNRNGVNHGNVKNTLTGFSGAACLSPEKKIQ